MMWPSIALNRGIARLAAPITQVSLESQLSVTDDTAFKYSLCFRVTDNIWTIVAWSVKYSDLEYNCLEHVSTILV